MSTPSPDKRPARRVTRLALLTAIALTVFIIEFYIPNPVPLPGFHLGLANIVTVYAVFALGAGDALLILLARVLLGSMFSGRLIVYSMAGALTCWCLMLLLRRLGSRQIWLCSTLCGAAHNAAQLLCALLLLRTPQAAVYLPALVLAGLVAGLFTGVCAQLLVDRLKLLP